MVYRSLLLLYCISKFNGERSVFGIYHLLNGKKSSQTIQDSKIFGLSFLFQTLQITRHDLINELSKLEEDRLILKTNDKSYQITDKGSIILNKAIDDKVFYIPKHLDGWKYGSVSIEFWKKLVLIIQTTSFLLEGRNNFFPITKDNETLHWCKSFFLSTPYNRQELAKLLYEECYLILKQLPEVEAKIFVLKLSGKDRVGLTNHQISELLIFDEDEIHFLFQAVLHFFVKRIKNAPNYRILPLIVGNSEKELPLTLSTSRTYELIKKNYQIEQISKLRGLKKGTIEDHIVEIVLNDPSFDISPFVSEALQDSINKTVLKLGTRKMKVIKEYLEDSVSYFQIRLVVAKEGEKNRT